MERNEAIESLRKLYSDTNAENKAALDYLIPELAESEDERIRKGLIKEFRNYYEMYDKSCGEPKWGFDSLAVRDILAWLERSDMGLIQRSWYMQGYIDGKYKLEPMWITKTGPGGTKHEKNERYGQPLPEQKPAAWSEEDIKKILSEEYKKGFNDATSVCKPKEWSEEGKK